MATGYLEQLVEERKWQEELTKVDVQFLYHIMNDAAVNMDFRYRALICSGMNWPRANTASLV
jgi:hypothetical protein